VGTYKTVTIPSDYAGGNACYYNSSNINGLYNNMDGWQVLAYTMFFALDINKDGTVDIDFEAKNLNFQSTYVDDIPYMWAPSILEVVVWQ
jgi:hypothetical protein